MTPSISEIRWCMQENSTDDYCTASIVRRGFVCSYVVDDKNFKVIGESRDDVIRFCRGRDWSGEATYTIVVILMFATAIAFIIGMVSFKKKQYDEWDRQAGMYLNGMYKRQLKEEKERSRSQASGMPQTGLMTLITGMALGPDAKAKKQNHEKMNPDMQTGAADSDETYYLFSEPADDDMPIVYEERETKYYNIGSPT